jgi:hypothetical protein
MLLITPTGLPGIECSRCRESVSVDLAVAVKFAEMCPINFLCIDCAEELKTKHPGSRYFTAREFLEALVAPGRPKRLILNGS